MSELFANHIADQRTTGRWSTSMLLHLAVILVLAFFPWPKPSVIKEPVPQPSSTTLIYFPTPVPRVVAKDNRNLQSPTQMPLKAVTEPPKTSSETNQGQDGRVKTDVFLSKLPQQPTAQPSPTGNVVIGTLDRKNTSGGQPPPNELVGPTGLLDPGRPGSQAPPASQQASNRPARLLRRPEPVYTEEARRLNITGDLKLIVWLKVNGEVQFVGFPSDKRLGHGLDEAAKDAVNHARCEAALKDGVAVDVKGIVTVYFRLSSVR